MRVLTALGPLPFVALILSAGAVGCADAMPPGITPAASAATPGPRESLVTFVRPKSTCDTGEWAIIVDDRGQFVANVPTESQVSVRAKPGPHTFYGWSNDDIQMEINRNINPVAAVRLETVAGQSHYVTVRVESPCSVRSTFEMRAVSGNTAGWADLEDWLKVTKPFDVNRAVGQSELDAEPVHLRRHLDLGRAKAVLNEQNQNAATEHVELIKETASRTE